MAEINAIDRVVAECVREIAAQDAGSDFAALIRIIDAQAAEIERLRDALKYIKFDLFLQIESRHGPRAASEYPSIVRANEALEVQK